MKDYGSTLVINGKEYPLVFNINVMEEIQKEYGTVDKWGELTDASEGEPNAAAVIFGIRTMMNEGIDIRNEKEGTNEPFLTHKQVGRLITDYGVENAAVSMNEIVVESTKSDEKN